MRIRNVRAKENDGKEGREKKKMEKSIKMR